MRFCMIEVAFANKEEVEVTIDELLKNRLVASCQVLKSESTWNWKKEREYSNEYILLMKTRYSLQDKIYNAIKRIHSYDCFEFAVFDLNSCNEDYLMWIKEETNNE